MWCYHREGGRGEGLEDSQTLTEEGSTPSPRGSTRAGKVLSGVGGGRQGGLPGRPVYLESFNGHVRVLQVDTVCEEGLDIVKVLRFELGHRGEPVVILLDQLGHEVLVKSQLVVPGDHHLELVREPPWKRTEEQVKAGGQLRGKKRRRLKQSGVELINEPI